MISTELLRQHLGGIGSSDTDDAILERVEQSACAHVEGWTNRNFRASAALVEIYDGNGEESMELRSPVLTGTPVVEIRSGGSWTTLSSDSYNVEKNDRLTVAGVGIRSVLALEGQSWPWGDRNIRVTYTGGYAEAGEPEEIRFLVTEIAAYWFRERLTSSPSTLSNLDRQRKGGLPDHLVAILNRWTRVERTAQPRMVLA